MDLQELMSGWLEAVKETGFVAKGSIHEYRRNCGRKSCKKCASGERHTAWQMTYYLDGRQRSKYIQEGQLDELRRAIANGRKLEDMMVRFGLEYLDATKKSGKKK
jgi:hypothetical protein